MGYGLMRRVVTVSDRHRGYLQHEIEDDLTMPTTVNVMDVAANLLMTGRDSVHYNVADCVAYWVANRVYDDA